MRSIPAYENAMKYCFERCLDLYLCPRVRKNRLNIDPESLKPKLPSRKELKPYPTTCYVGWRWVPYFLLSSMAQVMELFVSGRLKLAHVLGSGRLMNLLVVLLEILCPIFIFWLFLCNQTPSVSWIKDDKHMGLKLRHFKIVTAVEWHQKGDYFSTVMLEDIL
ncbi:Ribosome biogenesis protein erb1 [Glycine soja]|uniref:Ribosome biogenesis protein erb1 n=1 Tax=Glycine soja TaxID=3848 RepID=A0A0B2R4E2_GLYSO|nr:Ribosome biogenesis protein erb1 [Glycine soja]